MKYALTCTALFLGLAMVSSAGLIPIGPTTLTSNVNSLPTLLTIQNTGTASGCVGFINGSDVMGLAACPGGFTGNGGNELSAMTATRTIGQLNAAGITNANKLLIVFHSGEPGGAPVSVQDLALTFFDLTNDLTFTASLAGTPLSLGNTAQFSGTNTGFAFGLDSFQAGLAADFFSNAQNRVGTAATLSGSAGGMDTFVVTAAPSAPTAVPEPSTLYAVLSGLVAAMCLRKKYRHD